MTTQFDHTARIVSLANLTAMCERISGTCHTFQVVKVSRSRVHVEYSNPTEYGTPQPITAVYPCYPNQYESDSDNPAVVLDALRYIHDDGGYISQAFDALTDCPTLWRAPDRFQMNAQGAIRQAPPVWESHAEIIARTPSQEMFSRMHCGCTVCDVKKAEA